MKFTSTKTGSHFSDLVARSGQMPSNPVLRNWPSAPSRQVSPNTIFHLRKTGSETNIVKKYRRDTRRDFGSPAKRSSPQTAAEHNNIAATTTTQQQQQQHSNSTHSNSTHSNDERDREHPNLHATGTMANTLFAVMLFLGTCATAHGRASPPTSARPLWRWCACWCGCQGAGAG